MKCEKTQKNKCIFNFGNIIIFIVATIYRKCFGGDGADSNGDSIVYILTSEDYDTAAERHTYNSIIKNGIEEYAAVAEEGFGAAETATALYDKMTYEITYAYEEDGTTPQDAPWAHNILGVFEKKTGVCEAYARTYELLLNYLNIDNILVTGKSHGENHAWNLVGVDGVYYWSDCTWGAEDGSTTRFYNLKGNNNWADHTPDTMDIASGQVLYDLPENISDEDCTFKQIKVYENDQYIGMVNDIDDAFALMTNESSSYKLILNNRGQYLVYTSEWPAVNSIEIKASRYILKGSGFVCPDIQLVTEVTVNSDMVLSCVNVVTETNYYLYQNNNYCAEINIQNNTIL